MATPSAVAYGGRTSSMADCPPSALGAADRSARLHKARVRTLAFGATTLAANCRIERDDLLTVIEGKRFWRVEAQWPQSNPTSYGTSEKADLSEELR